MGGARLAKQVITPACLFRMGCLLQSGFQFPSYLPLDLFIEAKEGSVGWQGLKLGILSSQ
jgi:hypothetical protein